MQTIERCLIEIMNYFLSTAQVFMPNMVYTGQNMNIPVNKGTTPIQPHGEKMPIAANVIKITPAMIRIALSIVPTFIFMLCLAYWVVGEDFIITNCRNHGSF